MSKVLQFRDRLGKELLYSKFASLNEFESKVRMSLTHLIREEAV